MVQTPPKLFNKASWLNPILKTNTLEHVIRWPVIFGVIVLYQSLFIERSIRIPERLNVAFKNSAIMRLVGLWLIALSATQDVESAFVAAILFLTTIYVFKTKEERRRDGFWGRRKSILRELEVVNKKI